MYDMTSAINLDTCDDAKIVWRSDDQYFACSFQQHQQRLFKVWNRDLELQFVSETVPGIESCLAWKPSGGGHLFTTQRQKQGHYVTMFEMNGLKHNSFKLPCRADEIRVTSLQWNCDSTVLMVVYEKLETGGGGGVMLWTVRNCCWALKQRTFYESRVVAATFDSVKKHRLHVVVEAGVHYMYEYGRCVHTSGHTSGHQLASARSGGGGDASTLPCSFSAVVYGNELGITPFSYAKVPPPFSYYKLRFHAQVQQIAFSRFHFNAAADDDDAALTEHMAVLTSDSRLLLFGLPATVQAHPAAAASEFDPVLVPNMMRSTKSGGGCSLGCYSQQKLKADVENIRHLVWPTPKLMIAAVDGDETSDFLLVINLEHGTGDHSITTLSEGMKGQSGEGTKILAICVAPGSALILLDSDEVMSYSLSDATVCPYTDVDGQPVYLSPQHTNISYVGGKLLALSEYGKLHADNELLYSDETVTSYAVSDEFLLATTARHELLSLPLEALGECEQVRRERTIRRAVERGAVIVNHPVHLTSVVLELPRGNIEVVEPRSLVVTQVRKWLDAGLYGEAMECMRRHRIDMNLIHDNKPEKFLAEVGLFVKAVNNPSYVLAFIEDLREEDSTKKMYEQYYYTQDEGDDAVIGGGKVDRICDKLIEFFSTDQPLEYMLIPCIYAHTRKSTPEIKEALIRVQRLRNEPTVAPHLVGAALYHLSMKVDYSSLFGTALGTYDLELALLVAQESREDPKEYMPFLGELQQLPDENTRRYRIELHLKQYARALFYLSCTPDSFQQCCSLIQEHKLYREALSPVYETGEITAMYESGSHEHRHITELYARHLSDGCRKHKEAGLLLQRCGMNKQAFECYSKSPTTCWRHLLKTARALKYSASEFRRTALMVRQALAEANKYADAAAVYEQLNMKSQAVECLMDGRLFDEALSMCGGDADLWQKCIRPKLEEHAATLCDGLQHQHDKFNQYKRRLSVVRENKLKAAANEVSERERAPSLSFFTLHC